MKNIVVVGGGTGTFTILRSIKNINNLNITAIVTSADSGGSTGRLRDEFGNLPVGDYRQCLVALADEYNDDNNLLRDLFQYRFSKGGSLEGHNFGNLFLTALTDILGSEEEAFRKASKILNIKGRVFPITFDDIQLVAEYENGEIAYGEDMIDEPNESHDGTLQISNLWVQPKDTKIYEKSKEAVLNADYIIMGPGDLYTSILACVVVDDFAKVIRDSEAKIIYTINLVNKYGQTHGYKASDYIQELERYLGKKIDHILINNAPIPDEIIKEYEKEKAYPVLNDFKNDERLVVDDLISNMLIERKSNDKVKRSLLRHDITKLTKIFEEIL